jgi:hypothetical protein
MTAAAALLPFVGDSERSSLSRQAAEWYPLQGLSEVTDDHLRRFVNAAPESWLATADQMLQQAAPPQMPALLRLLPLLPDLRGRLSVQRLLAVAAQWRLPWMSLDGRRDQSIRPADAICRALFDAALV